MSSVEFWAAFAALTPQEQEVMQRRHQPGRLAEWRDIARVMGGFDESEVRALYDAALAKLGVPAVDVRDSQFGGL